MTYPVSPNAFGKLAVRQVDARRKLHSARKIREHPFEQRYCTFNNLRDELMKRSVVLRMDIVDIWRRQRYAAVIGDVEVRRQPLEPFGIENGRDVIILPWFDRFARCCDGKTIDDGKQRWVHEIQDLAVRPWVPVFLRVGDRLERGDSGSQVCLEGRRYELV